MGSRTPVVLLDLDGVLNPFAASVCPEGYVEREVFDGEEPVRYCRAHTAWIAELASVAELWWATGWGRLANDIYLPLLNAGNPQPLDPLPVVEFPPVPFEPELKVAAIDDMLGDRPAAWIDDNHTETGRMWARERPVPTLLVSTDPAVGWTRPHVDQVVAWISALGDHSRRR